MTLQREDDLRIAERAAEWWFILAEGDTKDQAAFKAWLCESARHIEEFLFISTVLQAYKGFDAQRRIDVDALMAQSAANVVALQDASHPRLLPEGGRDPLGGSRDEVSPRTVEGQQLDSLFFRKRAGVRSFRTRRVATLAATLVGVAVGLGWLLSLHSSQTFATAVGELRSFELADGSTLLLNTQSKVEVNFSGSARDVRLVSGEAMFKVTRNPARPFRVHSGSAVIQAVGTQFNVYRRDEGTQVSVIEGSVQISNEKASDSQTIKQPSPVKAGEQADIAPNGRVKQIAAMDPVRTVAWQQRRLVFLDEPLSNVAEEFNRYNRIPLIQVEDGAVGSDEITGVFDADDPESLIEFLKRDEQLVFERAAERIVIRARDNQD